MNLVQTSLIVLSGFPVLATALLGYQLLRNGQGVMGRPTLASWLFYSAKLTVACLFVILLAAGIKPEFFHHFPWLIQNEIPQVQKLMSAIFLLAGNLFLIPAYFLMSIFTRVGLPQSPHILLTKGIYRISRNPMYLSFWFFFPGCFLLVPSLVPAALMAFCLVTHHFIILNEEKFLTAYFNGSYHDYKQEVARYL